MSALSIERISVEDYFEIERTSQERYEYVHGEIFAMAGASDKHNIISANTFSSLHAQVRKRPCFAYNNDMRVRFSPTHYSYPDIAVVCGEKQIDVYPLDTLLNPTVIIEVLSSSTETSDKTNKARDFRALASIQEYLFIAQDEIYIEHYARHDTHKWLLREITELSATIELKSIACTLLVDDIYEKIEFLQS